MTAALVIVLAVVLVAWLTASATAVRSVSRVWVRRWVEQRLAGSGMAGALLERPQRLVLAAAAGTSLVVALAGAALVTALANTPAGLAAAAIALAATLLVLGQLVPRAIARRWTAPLVTVLLPPLNALAFVLAPAITVARALARLVRPARHAGADGDDIEDMLREGELEGISEAAEIEIITGVVQFGEKVVRDVMTPRTQVFAVDDAMPPAEMARAIAHSGYSRVPVYHGSLDEIAGMVHVFDVLKTGGVSAPPLRRVMQAPLTKRCSDMLFEMLRRQQHLAIVLDEFGGTAGIVTLEDLLEELVGDIRDEHDEPARPASSTGTAHGDVVDGTAPLADVAQRFGVTIPETAGQPSTIGGAVVRALGRIPAVGERFTLGDLELTVVDAEPSRVRRVLVQRAGSVRVIDLRAPH